MRTQSNLKSFLRENNRALASVNRNWIEVIMNSPLSKPLNTRTTHLEKFMARFQFLQGLRKVTIGTAATLLVAMPVPGIAVPLDLSNVPLYLSSAVPPNIFFLADDSGSMDWNFLTSESDGQMHLPAGGPATTTYSYVFPQADNNYAPTAGNGRILPDTDTLAGLATMPADRHGVWRGRFSGYNTLYYNPEVRYTPWLGVDAAGTTFGNADPQAARLDPYSTTGGTNIVDLTAAMSWTSDSVPVINGYDRAQNGATNSTIVLATTASATNGFYTGMTLRITSGCKNGQTRTVGAYNGTTKVATVTTNWGGGGCNPNTTSNYLITTSVPVTGYYAPIYYTWKDSNTDGLVGPNEMDTKVSIIISQATYAHILGNRSDCATPTLCTYNEEIVNFANWFSYYRRRILTSKNAIAKVIAPSSAYMGFGTLHDNGAVNNQISLMNSSLTSGNKKALLDSVYLNFPANSTPLRTKLDQTGKYYECATGSIFGSAATCPLLPAASGGSCQKNFTIMMTDGYYNDTFTLSAPTNKDGDGNTTFDGGAYADRFSHTLADVAMHYYERDLSTSLTNDVTVDAVDTATHQHMVTYSVAFGVNGTLTAGPSDATAAFAWPDPALSNAGKIDDLRHAAYNSRGKFLSARDPTALVDALTDALADVDSRSSSAAAVAVNSYTLTTDTTVYQALFNPGNWSGDLRALPIRNGRVDLLNPLWNAGKVLTPDMWDTGRQIITRNDATNKGVAFRWASLSAAQKTSLDDDPDAVAADNKSKERVNWLRGNKDADASFRKRIDSAGGYFVLGDLTNSAPIFVNAPGDNYPDTLIGAPNHSVFKTTYAGRRRVIYVGGNDGMLHGFDAGVPNTTPYDPGTGKELLAYVPAAIYPNLSQLTSPNYAHRYYVDGSPTAGDVYASLPGCAPSPCWRTVLVSGLAGGGKAIFALDVTDPSIFTESAIPATTVSLWEISAASDNDLGYTYAQPTIARVRTAASTYKWVAIFGNGYNSVNESAALYIVDIENGNVLRKIVADTGTGNGLSTPRVFDQDGDFAVDYVYAGDLKGNLWKFDLTADQAAWAVAYGSTPLPLFKALDNGNVAQPITERPAVSKHPVTTLTGNMIYFGTGRYLSTTDKTPSASPVHTFYGIWDKGVTSLTVPVLRADLQPQTISAPTVSTRSITSTPFGWRQTGTVACDGSGTGECLGWRVDLPVKGEMSVTNPVLATADLVDIPRIIFTTLIPNDVVCKPGENGWLMELNPTYGSLLPRVIDTNDDGIVDANDALVAGLDLGIGIISEPVLISDPQNKLLDKAVSGSKGDVKLVAQSGKSPVVQTPGLPGSGAGRKSWRQLK